MIQKPMLAVAVKDIETLDYPIYVSPKLDGIRCLKIDGVCVSRKFKPIPNKFIREWIEKNLPDGIDGELMAGKTFNEAQSLIMTQEGEPDFTYQLFDFVRDDCDKPFNERQFDLCLMYDKLPQDVKARVIVVPQYLTERADELTWREEQFIEQGYEGAMIRSMDGPYKNGRSTLREGYLLKLKRFEDSEATIVGFEEQMHNANEAEQDAFGRTKRSSCKDGLIPAGTLGKLILLDNSGITFGCGTGLDQALRQEIWDDQNKYLGKTVKFKHQPSGAKDGPNAKPRFPIFLGFRHEDDM